MSVESYRRLIHSQGWDAILDELTHGPAAERLHVRVAMCLECQFVLLPMFSQVVARWRSEPFSVHQTSDSLAVAWSIHEVGEYGIADLVLYHRASREPCGFIRCRSTEGMQSGRIVIEAIYVDERNRRKGYAALMLAVLKELEPRIVAAYIAEGFATDRRIYSLGEVEARHVVEMIRRAGFVIDPLTLTLEDVT